MVSFHSFSELAAELQHKIWDFAAEDCKDEVRFLPLSFYQTASQNGTRPRLAIQVTNDGEKAHPWSSNMYTIHLSAAGVDSRAAYLKAFPETSGLSSTRLVRFDPRNSIAFLSAVPERNVRVSSGDKRN